MTLLSALEASGLALVVAGVVLVSIPAALIVCGAGIVLIAWNAERNTG